jgi:hypothetical protein
MMGFLKKTQNDVLTLQASNDGIITWHLDAAFGVHKDLRSHTGGATMMLGAGAIRSVSTKHKVNAGSSTEADLISIDDVISKVLWKNFSCKNKALIQNILLGDNQSSMKTEMNRKIVQVNVHVISILNTFIFQISLREKK